MLIKTVSIDNYEVLDYFENLKEFAYGISEEDAKELLEYLYIYKKHLVKSVLQEN
ncbi:hypothetical protein [Campylobacter hyointestinalis]|uniref:Uncharacterized protein n=1 Tax=Campylobacter hyointestinalis subsp. hyointestinalis TaxID=91352 RepID=A0A0S4SMT8_CAMHY|nr:hypothetical protein [Campylobacter hyointestinalis]CUU71290.1 Uncharacterised protein [Campylobacter hyointestinalis subsp. hyointestinalis]CUU87535.1 Uncharacterised protein [Campylobacter hyointestinalis subsp. hyointestinalis]